MIIYNIFPNKNIFTLIIVTWLKSGGRLTSWYMSSWHKQNAKYTQTVISLLIIQLNNKKLTNNDSLIGWIIGYTFKLHTSSWTTVACYRTYISTTVPTSGGK